MDDRKIFDDLRQLSHGNIDMNPESMTLTASKDIMNRSRRTNTGKSNTRKK